MTRLAKSARLATAVLIGLASLTTAGCSDSDSLKVCTTLPYPPFQYVDKKNDDKIVGFDVDMINKVAKKLGKKQEIVDTGFQPIKSGEAMANGTCAIAAAAITITPERKKVMDFSDPYYNSYQSLAVVPKSKIKDLSDLRGKTVGAQGDTTGEEYLKKREKKYGYTIKSFKDLGQEREALIGEQIDAAINDVPVWTDQLDKDPGSIVIAARYNTGEKYGYAVAKGDKETLDAINAVIKDVKSSGYYQKLCKKWIHEKCR
ncbi:MAG TPA: ABC transporter substrate-binding protein [Stackebrandtia sp.]|jgi:polar amino acid transport system substrate-binding protein|uniref:ABC transporter substrate-binding protein n=1 Tax=Stackebrandtia sp. TaxID=2023065 RepID=UPI002D5132D5|nr:ABC transporter substrate-binding protein [Stackebrandtia sp.]HZE38577.1 ABC transporter substrate-binding protein [Stackebrandtia sp.]